MILDTIIKLFQVLIVYISEEGSEPTNSTFVFESEEIICLGEINKKMNGNPTKLSNPNLVTELKGAVWL